MIDAIGARVGFELGFAVLDHSQHGVADRLPGVRLDWFTADNTATARQAIAASGPELVGLVVYLLTPLVSAVLLPLAIGWRCFPFPGSWDWPRLPVCPCCWVRCGRRGDLLDVPTRSPTKPILRSLSASSSSPEPNRRYVPRVVSSLPAAWSDPRLRASTAR